MGFARPSKNPYQFRITRLSTVLVWKLLAEFYSAMPRSLMDILFRTVQRSERILS